MYIYLNILWIIILNSKNDYFLSTLVICFQNTYSLNYLCGNSELKALLFCVGGFCVMKIWRSAMAYLIAGLLFGLYFREMTKYFMFEGETVLASLHTHALVLGTMMALIVILFEGVYQITSIKGFNRAWLIYQIGVWFLLIMNAVRGTVEVMGLNISYGIDMSIVGIAGISHIILSIGLVLLLLVVRKAIQLKLN